MDGNKNDDLLPTLHEKTELMTAEHSTTLESAEETLKDVVTCQPMSSVVAASSPEHTAKSKHETINENQQPMEQEEQNADVIAGNTKEQDQTACAIATIEPDANTVQILENIQIATATATKDSAAANQETNAVEIKDLNATIVQQNNPAQLDAVIHTEEVTTSKDLIGVDRDVNNVEVNTSAEDQPNTTQIQDTLSKCETNNATVSLAESLVDAVPTEINNSFEYSKVAITSYIDNAVESQTMTAMDVNEDIVTANIAQDLPAMSAHIPNAHSSLSLLAQYDSSSDNDSDDIHIIDTKDNEVEKISDSESVVEVPTSSKNNRDYRNRVVEINSDSDSDSDANSSVEDANSEIEYLSVIRKEIDKAIGANDAVADDVDDDDDDDEENIGGRIKRQPLRVKGEFLIDDLPPIQDLHITVPEEECIELGKVHSIVDQLVLVNTLPNSVLLDIDSVLFLDKGKRVLGEVFDVLGQVADPLYCVRFNSNKQIQEKKIQIGDVVFVAPKTEHTQFIILSSLMKMRGSDASWEDDVEPPPRHIDYSDDEEEREARASRKHAQRNKSRANEHDDPTKRLRSDVERSSPSPSSSFSVSPSLSPSPRPRFQSYNRGRGGYRPPPRFQQPNHDYRANYNAGSWHSNYPQQYRTPPPTNYALPPHAQPNVMFPPPNFSAYPPHAAPVQRYQAQPHQQQAQPMYIFNPYAVGATVIQPNGQPMYAMPPPPPPPGAL